MSKPYVPYGTKRYRDREKSTTFNAVEKGSKLFFTSLFTFCLSLLPFYVKFEQLNVNKWPKWATEYPMRDWVPTEYPMSTSLYCLISLANFRLLPNERQGTSGLSYVFLKIYPYDPTSTKTAQNLLYRFFKKFGSKRDWPLQINYVNFIIGCMVHCRF